MAEEEARIEKLGRWNREFIDLVPFNRALGIESLAFAAGRASLRLPYRDDLADPLGGGGMHGGALTALLDAACGAAVFMKLPRPVSIATLELRLDHLERPLAGRDVVCEATCTSITRHVAFVRAEAWHEAGALIATASGSFMLGTPLSRGPR